MGDRPRFDREGEDAVSETPQDEVSQDQVAVPHALLEWEEMCIRDSNVTDEQIIKALKQANAYEFVAKFKGGLDAQLGERGVKLSGGQKQRIQIARAILHDKPISVSYTHLDVYKRQVFVRSPNELL